MAMFDLFDNLSQKPKTFYDQFLENRQLMEQQNPGIAAQMPVLGANTPGQSMYAAQQQQAPDATAQTVKSLADVVAQASVGPEAKPKDVQAAGSGVQEVLDSVNPLKPLPQYGPQGFGKALGMPENAGGILGLGVQPIDLLSFALFAAMGRGQSPEAAMKTAMWGAGLPRAFRENQEKKAYEFVQAKQAEFNSQIAGGNLEERRQESLLRQAATMRKNAILDWTTKRLATGQPLTPQERMQLAGQAHGIFDPNFIKEFVITPDFDTQRALIERAQGISKDLGLGSVSATLDAPGGMKVTLGNPQGSSGRAVVTGELSDAMSTGILTPKLQAAGFENMDQVRGAYTERKAAEAQRIGIARDNSERAQAALEMIRPEESKKLTALSNLHRAASDMLVKYEASLKSHGGKLPPSIQGAMQAATTSPDGFIGKTIQAIGQRVPGITQQDYDFISRFASMQKFSRGLLDDVGNLSNFERGIADTIKGTPLDVPAQFRSRIGTAIEDAVTAYDQERRSLGTTRNVSQFPEFLGAGVKKKEQAPAQQGELSQQGNAFLQELKKAMGK